MSLKEFLSCRHTLAFRLTLWYAGIFAVSLVAAFWVFFLMISSISREYTDRELLVELAEFSSLLELKGLDAVRTDIQIEAESEGVNRFFLRLLTPNGDVLISSDMSSWEYSDVNRTILKRLTSDKDYSFKTLAIPGRPHKVRVLYGAIGSDVILQMGLSLSEKERFLGLLRDLIAGTVVALTFFAAVIGLFMARRALSGVKEVTQAAQEISSNTLERRVSVQGGGIEIEELATTFNSMLNRINLLINSMGEITDNIAHDLKSPITRMRGIAETTLTTGKSADDFEAMAADIIEECDRLLEMINTMLLISEAEAGTTKLQKRPVDISRVVQEACELFLPIAEDKDISLEHEIPAGYQISGDIQRIQRMVANLLDNALKYTQSGGTVTVSLSGDEKQVVVSFRDNGVGISKDDLLHIFDRFYRCDQSRSQVGSGLGLSLALAIARSHGGNITAMSSPKNGTIFSITLPRL
ncbi:MAG: two-component sensor histidine kinase [Thermodesulfobacteriota bacterium]|nr:MAG: two-component sensor histidine kinase [Thermodesulfobacteriota bacterium]